MSFTDVRPFPVRTDVGAFRGHHAAPSPRRAPRLVAAAALTATVTLVAPASADAHVRVVPDSTAGGGFTKLTFRVPNESDTAGTTAVTVTFPADTPLAFVSVQPVPGWTAKVTRAKLPTPVTAHGVTLTEAVRTVTWTAGSGTQIGPGQFQEFAISGGPLPESGRLVFPAAQTYSDGTVVQWDQPPTPGEPEPEHPAPAFTLTAKEDGGAQAAPAAHGGGATAPGTPDDGDGAGDAPLVLSLAALLTAGAALAVAVLGRRRARTAA